MAENLDKFYTEEVYDFEEKNRLASNRVKSLVVLYVKLNSASINLWEFENFLQEHAEKTFFFFDL